MVKVGKNLFLSLVTFCLSEKGNAKQWEYIPIEERIAEHPVGLIVNIPQNELALSGDPALVSDPYAYENPYGLVGGVILDVLQSKREKKDHEEASPIQIALGNFDPTTPLNAGIQREIKSHPWIKPISEISSGITEIAANQVAIKKFSEKLIADVKCSYSLDRYFASVYVRCVVQVNSKDAYTSLPEKTRSSGKKALLSRSVESAIMLTNLSKDHDALKSRWIANSATTLRKSLSIALENAGELVIREISLTDNDIKAATNPNKSNYIDLISQSGVILDGKENLGEIKTGNFFIKSQQSIKPDTSGVLIVQFNGDLYRRQVISQ